ncbi:MAG: hypothetical protein ACSLFQ_16870 [Thermoanaerobaculia bacterium]
MRECPSARLSRAGETPAAQPARPALHRRARASRQSRPDERPIPQSPRLVPEEIRWIAASTEGRVEAVRVQPGAAVTAETVILDLPNPQQLQSALDAELSRRAADADEELAPALTPNCDERIRIHLATLDSQCTIR